MEAQRRSNNRKTWLLFFNMFVLIAIVSFVIYYFYGLFYAIVLMGSSIFFATWRYFGALKFVIKTNGMQLATRRQHRRLYLTVENYSIQLGMPMPKVYIIDDPALNAFAAGYKPEKSIIGVTTGLLEALDRQELEGVIAHEMGHILNRDTKVSLLAFTIVTVFAFIIDIGLRGLIYGGGGRSRSSGRGGGGVLILLAVGVIAFFLSKLFMLAISRRREYLADNTSAQITRYPRGLASALYKISQTGSVLKKSSTASAHLFISNPLKNNFWSRLFSTHPPTNERIAALQQLEQKGY